MSPRILGKLTLHRLKQNTIADTGDTESLFTLFTATKAPSFHASLQDTMSLPPGDAEIPSYHFYLSCSSPSARQTSRLQFQPLI